MKKIPYSKYELEKLYDKEGSIGKVASRLSRPYSTVRYWYYKNKIKVQPSCMTIYQELRNTPMSEFQKSIVLGSALGDGCLKLAPHSKNARLRIEFEDDALVAYLETKIKRGKEFIWKLHEKYSIGFKMESTPEGLANLNSRSFGELDTTYKGAQLIQQVYPGKYTFQAQKPRNRPHLYGDDPLGFRRTTQYPFSGLRAKRKRNPNSRKIVRTSEEQIEFDISADALFASAFSFIRVEKVDSQE